MINSTQTPTLTTTLTHQQFHDAFHTVAERFKASLGSEADAHHALDLLEKLCENPNDFWEQFLAQPIDEDGLAARLLHKHGPDITWKQMRDAVAAEYKIDLAPADEAR